MNQVYWLCPTSPTPRDGIYLLRMIVVPAGLLANICTLVLLCLLTGRTRTSLTMLRALMLSDIASLIIALANPQDVGSILPSANEIFASTICAIWPSGFLAAVFHLFESLVLVYTVSNRAIQIAFKYQYSFSSAAYMDLVSAGFILLACFLLALPQCFTVAWRQGHCQCLDRDLPYELLTVLYAASFVKYGVDMFVNATALSISSVIILLWVRNTPPDKLVDTLNSLAFSGTSESLRKEFEQPQGWWTTSMCMVVLSVNFLLSTAYSSVQRFVSAAGVFLLDINSYWTRVGDLLLLLHMTTAPFIIMIYIPALRHLMKSFYWNVAAACRFTKRNFPSPVTDHTETAQ
ncbi:unnamed protein product [Schistocephalus solidus]|uniref:G_PROTEIN_RECEP_F1_2 domain-containing protein n=1 Tax=Schistocephalus solidus TaxID=70667 RepID=A0A183T2L5_SCHSO|nr:unnamed protein product [Schistocephalus solidus]